MFKNILKLYLLFVMVFTGCVTAQDPPSGYTTNYKFRMWAEGAYPSADSVNQNLIDIDLAIKNRDRRSDTLKAAFQVLHNYPSGTMKDGVINFRNIDDVVWGNGLGWNSETPLSERTVQINAKKQYFDFQNDSLKLKFAGITGDLINPSAFSFGGQQNIIVQSGEQGDYTFGFAYDGWAFTEGPAPNGGLFLNDSILLSPANKQTFGTRNNKPVHIRTNNIDRVKIDDGSIELNGQTTIKGEAFIEGGIYDGVAPDPQMNITAENNERVYSVPSGGTHEFRVGGGLELLVENGGVFVPNFFYVGDGSGPNGNAYIDNFGNIGLQGKNGSNFRDIQLLPKEFNMIKVFRQGTPQVDLLNLDSNGVLTTKTIVTDNYYVSSFKNAPSSSSDTGTEGEIRFGHDGYLYLCTATDTWIRVQLSTW